MKGTLAILAVILLAVAGIGFWQGWFSFAKDSKVGVTVDTGKMDQDKKAFSKAVGDKVASLKETLSGLWKKSETVKAEEATALKKELEGLRSKERKSSMDCGVECRLSESGGEEDPIISELNSKAKRIVDSQRQ